MERAAQPGLARQTDILKSQAVDHAIQPVGVIWYRREEDYARLKAMAKDGEKLHDTYDEWLKSARNVAGTLTLEGFTVVKTYLDPKTFPAWCEADGYEMDAVARTRYSQECAAS